MQVIRILEVVAYRVKIALFNYDQDDDVPFSLLSSGEEEDFDDDEPENKKD